MPSSIMICQNFHLRFSILIRFNQQDIFYCIPYEHGHIAICKIVITVEWHIDLPIYGSIFMSKAKVWCFCTHILRSIYLALGVGNRSIMTPSAIIKNDVPFLGPELMADTIILSLTEAWPKISSLHVDQPDSLLNIIPRSFMTEHCYLWIIRRKLKMTQPMCISKYIMKFTSV